MGVHWGWDDESRDRQNRLVALLAGAVMLVATVGLIVTDPAPGEPGFERHDTTETTR